MTTKAYMVDNCGAHWVFSENRPATSEEIAEIREACSPTRLPREGKCFRVRGDRWAVMYLETLDGEFKAPEEHGVFLR
jgi:hypothetical protein